MEQTLRSPERQSKLQQTLAYLIQERNITIVALSKKSNVSRSTISGWLHGSRPRDLHELKRVSDALGVSFEMLCLGRDDQIAMHALSGLARKIEAEGFYYLRVEKVEQA